MNIFKDITLIYVAHKSGSIIKKNIQKFLDLIFRKNMENQKL